MRLDTACVAGVPDQVMQGMLQPIRDFFRDEVVRFGIKFGLAGVLAVYLALFMRLGEPTWALFTVFVLMIAQYVGAMAEKAVLRLIGTVIGGIIGYLLTGSLEQEPLVFVLLVGLVTGFSTAMFGQNQYPYAFLLCGLTVVVVAGNGMSDPQQSWMIALVRVEEICVGIVASLLVNNLVWPRYARVEFLEKTHAAFADLRDCFVSGSRMLLHGSDPEALVRIEDFLARLTSVRTLLHFGARESRYFRGRLSTYQEMLSTLSRIAAAMRTLGQELPGESAYRRHVGTQLESIHSALIAGLDALSQADGTPDSRTARMAEIDAAFAAFETQVAVVRDLPEIRAIPPEESMIYGIHTLALEDIRQQIRRAAELTAAMPGTIVTQPPEPFSWRSMIPPPFWIRTGIKSGLAIMIGLFIVNWLQPPGGAMVGLGAWVFTALNPMAPGGQGDRRAFHFVAAAGVGMAVLILVLFLVAPLLSSFSVLVIFIFTALFVWGFAFRQIGGISVTMQIAMLCTVSIVGLNSQRVVAPQAILSVYFGIMLGLIIAACVQRLLWPSLPQYELRDRLVEYARHCIAIVDAGSHGLPLAARLRLALIPGEAAVFIRALERPQLSATEAEKLQNYLLSLRRVAADLIVSAGRLGPLLEGEQADEGRRLIAELEESLRSGLAAHIDALEAGQRFAPLDESLETLLDAWRQWLGEFRARMLTARYPIMDAIRIIGLSGRYEQAGRDLLAANAIAARARIDRLSSDYVL